MTPRSSRRPVVALACLMLSAVAAAAPAVADDDVRGLLALADRRMNVDDRGFDWRDEPARRQLNKHWYLGKQRGTHARYGFVREGEHSDFSITGKGVRIAFKF
jgi:hypothetical protein